MNKNKYLTEKIIGTPVLAFLDNTCLLNVTPHNHREYIMCQLDRMNIGWHTPDQHLTKGIIVRIDNSNAHGRHKYLVAYADDEIVTALTMCETAGLLLPERMLYGWFSENEILTASEAETLTSKLYAE